MRKRLKSWKREREREGKRGKERRGRGEGSERSLVREESYGYDGSVECAQERFVRDEEIDTTGHVLRLLALQRSVSCCSVLTWHPREAGHRDADAVAAPPSQAAPRRVTLSPPVPQDGMTARLAADRLVDVRSLDAESRNASPVNLRRLLL